MPDWLDVLAQWSWRLLVGIALLAVAVAAVVQVPTVLLPIVLAAVLASTFAPLMQALRRRGWGNSAGGGPVTIGAFAGIAAIVAADDRLARSATRTRSRATRATGPARSATGCRAWPGRWRTSSPTSAAGSSGTVASILASLVQLAFVVVLAAILTFFFLRDGEAAWAAVTSRLSHLATPGRSMPPPGARSGSSAAT